MLKTDLYIEALQIAQEIQIKKFKAEFDKQPVLQTPTELLYKFDKNKFLYVINYGLVVFCGFNALEISEHIKYIKQYANNILSEAFKEEIYVNVDDNDSQLKFEDDVLYVPQLDRNALQIIMLNVGQSATLDYYETLSFDILNQTKAYTDELEQKGKINANKTNLLKFIGKTLNIKHSIIDNLYVFDAPDITWDDEYLSKLDTYTKKLFELRARYLDVDYRLKIIQDNVTLFTDMIQHKEDNRLEWIIIILILIEVVDLILSKLLKLW